MKRFLTISLSIAVGFVLAVLVLEPRRVAIGGVETCASRNGDVNADGRLDLSDPLTILGHLFLGNPTGLVPLCAQPGGASGLPATGQTGCWSYDGNIGIWVEGPCGEATCPGQDGILNAGCPTEGRFEDNGDGTVTDNCTGLMWQQDTADISDDGTINALGDTVVWCEALNYCDRLSFAGHDDWRLPNAKELQSIVDYGRLDPAIDLIFTSLLGYYWSSTTHAETPDNAWGIGFNSGGVYVRPKQGDIEFGFNFVRAVRGP